MYNDGGQGHRKILRGGERENESRAIGAATAMAIPVFDTNPDLNKLQMRPLMSGKFSTAQL